MPFREKQKIHLAPSTNVFQQELTELPTGEYVIETINQSEKNLPDPELFELKNQLNAGIELDEVNSKIMSNSNINVDKVIRKYTKKSNKNEVNSDENE